MSAYDDDCAIHDLLERRAPDRFDAFMQVVGRALHAMRPSLKRRLRRYGSVIDADEAISAAIERAVTYLRGQYLGHDVQFRFARSFGLSFQAWVACIVRLVALEQIKKGSRNPGNPSSTGDGPADVESVAAAETIESETEALKKALDIEALTEALKPRQQFVVRADFGFHDEGPLDGPAIVRLASKAQLPSREIRKMKRRAGAICPEGAKPSTRLSQAQIGQLLDVSERQVHNIKREALIALRAGAAAR
jgi:RNA polymerase sigma factor (sigma-70 family)